MRIQIKPQHIELSDREREYIEQKLQTLARFDVRVCDPSSLLSFHIEKSDIKTTDHKLRIEVTLHLPHGHLRAEVKGMTVFEGVDMAEEKLRKQLERYKARRTTPRRKG